MLICGIKEFIVIYIIIAFTFFLAFFANFIVTTIYINYTRVIIEVSIPYSNIMELPLSITFDFVSSTFFICVSLISGCIFIYRKFYITDNFKENRIKRFYHLILLFVISIFFLVFSNS